MNETFSLGRIAGVRVGMHWSVLVIFLLLFAGLATQRFPVLYPGASTAAYTVAAAIAASSFLLSLLAHELAHAVVATRHGVRVAGITLWMLGGVARLEGEADDPHADLRIAGVGPLVSLLLGVGFGGLAWAASSLGVSGLPLGVLLWLALINVVLGLFNLVPAAPLDGGRILRALLWRRWGDRTTAAVTAARAGRRFGVVLALLGLLEVLLTPGIGGVWLILIGWFISAMASAEEQQVRVRGALDGIRVGDVMTRDPLTVPRGCTVAELLEGYVLRFRFSAFPVVDERGCPVGLVTLNRVKEVVPSERTHVLVDRIMCPLEDVPRTSPDAALTEVVGAMAGSPDGRALVLVDGVVVGILSPTDVTRTFELAELREPALSR